MLEADPYARMRAWVDLAGTIVAALATAYYAWLTRKLWRATAKSAEIMERTLESNNEPLCAISNFSHSFGPEGRLSIRFKIQNAGRVPVDGVYLVSLWKGTDGSRPEYTDNTTEWVGVLLPGQLTEHTHERAVRRPAIKVVTRTEDTVTYETAIIHIAVSVQFKGSTSPAQQKWHVVLATFQLEDNQFKVRRSEIFADGGSRPDVWRLLDDVSAIGHGTAPASFFSGGRP
ncbi:hypothetical protein [uncultured Paludibaculum sp.]|uniref:hypothetical protein n=1 Tax=uncultured Paludibaculum sp. TaxID=1765020 RepID=UPI002AABA6C0|nr:hypothetical protein [uncultured Paludibaculum sp.]